MKCPHCLESFHAQHESITIGIDQDGGWIVHHSRCPSCNRFVISLTGHDTYRSNPGATSISQTIREQRLCRPKAAMRPAPSSDVPKLYAADYTEACVILSDSPKASAALSRRCLQSILRDCAQVKPSDLAREIQEVIDSGKLPSHLADSIDAIRNLGNFAAHPTKSKSSGEIVDVEPGEAEWNLDVLEGLFDFYFVQPALLKKKRDALNKKLADAGKPEMKVASIKA